MPPNNWCEILLSTVSIIYKYLSVYREISANQPSLSTSQIKCWVQFQFTSSIVEQKPRSGEGFTAAEGGCWSLWQGDICHMDGCNWCLPQGWLCRNLENRLNSLFCHFRTRNPFLVSLSHLIPLPFSCWAKWKRNHKNQKKTPNSIYLFTSHFCLSLFFKDPSFVSLIRCLIRERALLTNRGTKGTHDLIPRITPAQEFSLQHTQNKPLQGSALSSSPWPGTLFANIPLGWNTDGNWDFPAPKQPAQPWHRAAGWSRAGLHSQLPLCAPFVGCRSLGSPGNSVGSHTALPKLTLCQEGPKSLPDGWEVTPLCCLGALKAFSTQ